MSDTTMKNIFKQQEEFQKILGNDVTTQEFKNEMFLGLMEEVVELMKETPHKKHKKHQIFNKLKFLEEAVDIQLYLLNVVLASGYSYNKFIQLLTNKQKVNVERQKNGY